MFASSLSKPRLRWLVPCAVLIAAAAIALVRVSANRGGQARVSSGRAAGIPTPRHGAVLSFEPGEPGRYFAPGTIGLSIETKELAAHDLEADHTALVRSMRRLGPGVLRIGGGSSDDFWWTSREEPAPSWATSVIRPSDFHVLRRLLAATGWKAIVTLNLGHFDPARAADEAEHVEQILGRLLLGFAVGNEPDDYGKPVIALRASSYSPRSYLKELEAYVAATRGVAPGASFYGPDLASPAWLPSLVAEKATPFKALAEHYYPLEYSVKEGSCKATSIPTAADLLSPEVREQENDLLRLLLAAGEQLHSEAWITETNSTGSCDAAGGPTTSPVFASALWALDWSLRAASAGVGGIDFHGNFSHCGPFAGSPICAEGAAATVAGRVTARPEYYGLLAARQLEGGSFIPATLIAAEPTSNVTTWATVTPSGTVRIALDNLATSGAPVAISIPAAGYTATVETLYANSLEQTRGIRLGGAGIGSAGVWLPRAHRLRPTGQSFKITVGRSSAAIVRLTRRK
jgi:hypothetical protein